MKTKPYAAFAVVFHDFDPNLIWTVNRPGFNQCNTLRGLPGGKLEDGEESLQAAIREAEEEGLAVSHHMGVIHTDYVDGNFIVWHQFGTGYKLTDYKEKPRGVTPELTKIKDLAFSDLVNGFLLSTPRYEYSPSVRRDLITEYTIKLNALKEEQLFYMRRNIPDDIKQLAKMFAGGHKIEAIKLFKEAFNCGFKEAYDYLVNLAKEL